MKDMENEAFGDLNSLMAQAKDVVAVIKRFSVAQQKVFTFSRGCEVVQRSNMITKVLKG